MTLKKVHFLNDVRQGKIGIYSLWTCSDLLVCCVLAVLLAAGCGSKGDSGPTQSQGESPGEVSIDDPKVLFTGKFVWPETLSLTTDLYTLVSYDHSLNAIKITKLPESGDFQITNEFIQIGNIYSFHLLDQYFDYVLTIDFDSSALGVQGAIIFEGGLALEAETMTIEASAGTIGPNSYSTTATISGGFALYSQLSGSFSDLRGSIDELSFSVREILAVSQPIDLLRVFLSGQGTNAVRRKFFGDNIRHRLSMTLPEGKEITVMRPAETGLWLDGVDYIDENGAAAADWSVKNPLFNPIQGGAAVEILVRDSLFANRYLPLEFSFDSEVFQSVIVFLSQSIRYPHYFTAVAEGSGPASAIDYQGGSVNGLTQSFCIPSSDLTYSMRVPFIEGYTVTSFDITLSNQNIDSAGAVIETKTESSSFVATDINDDLIITLDVPAVLFDNEAAKTRLAITFSDTLYQIAVNYDFKSC